MSLSDGNETIITPSTTIPPVPGDNVFDPPTAVDIDESYRTCNSQSLFDLFYDPPPFQSNTAIESLHTIPPRFGHSSDINLLIQGSNQDQQDYLTGLLAGSFAIFCLFVCWMIMLTFLKCLGPNRVGFFAASRAELPPKPVKPKVLKRNQPKTLPFQHNGQAADRQSGATSSPVRKNSILKPVVKAPITVARKARAKRRELEKRNQFEKISDDSGDNDGVYIEDDEDDEDENGGTIATTSGDFSLATATNPSSPAAAGANYTEEEKKEIRAYQEAKLVYQDQLYRRQERIRRARIASGFCAIGILISGILFTIMTQDHFIESFENFGSGLDQANLVVEESLVVANTYLDRQASAKQSTRKFLVEINDICPNSETSVCSNLDAIETATSFEDLGCDFSSLPFGSELSSVVTEFTSTLNAIEEDVGDFAADLRELQALLDQANTYYPKHGVRIFWSAAGCTLALGAICMFLTGGMAYLELTKDATGREQPLPRIFACTRSYFLVPLIFLLALVCWILSMVFITTGIGSSDLCYNTPDVPLLNLLETRKDKFDSLLYLFLRYYVSGCPMIDAPRGLEVAIQTIQSTAIPAIASLSDAMQAQGIANLEDTCGGGIGLSLAALGAIGNQLCIFSLTLSDLRALFQCELWYPLYTSMMHDAVCGSATLGMTWAASTQTTIIVLVLIFLTLRIAYYEETEVSASNSAPGGCCPCFRSKQVGDAAAQQNNEASSSFVPSNEVRSGWFACCCGPRKPKGHIGEINIEKQSPPGSSRGDASSRMSVSVRAPPSSGGGSTLPGMNLYTSVSSGSAPNARKHTYRSGTSSDSGGSRLSSNADGSQAEGPALPGMTSTRRNYHSGSSGSGPGLPSHQESEDEDEEFSENTTSRSSDVLPLKD